MYDVENLYLNPVVFSANDGIFIFCYTVSNKNNTITCLRALSVFWWEGRGLSLPSSSSLKPI